MVTWGFRWRSPFAEVGEHVGAVDVDPRKVAAIRAGDSYVEDVSADRLCRALPHIDATSHFQPLARTDAIVICVPTPLTGNREPDLTALKNAAHAFGQVLQQGQLVVHAPQYAESDRRHHVRVRRSGR